MIDKAELRRELLKEMCNCAKNISTWYYWGEKLTSICFQDNEIPEAFNPGVADKFMFNGIIDSVIDNISNELENLEGKKEDSPYIRAVNIMAKFYYPYYGTWRKIKREELVKRMCEC